MGRVGLKYEVVEGRKVVGIEYIAKKLSRKTKSEIFDTMMEALDMMQQYNGRTRWQCIAMALGYEKEVKDNTEEMIYTKKLA